MNGESSSRRALLALLLPAALGACAAPDSRTTEPTLGSASQAIIGGTPADETYAAVGALVYYFPDVGVLDTFCSGTLVAPRAIVTARHCTRSIDLALESGLTPAFALGPDAFNPTQVVTITDYVVAPAGPGPENGLLLDGGRDVAVAHLEAAPVDVTPVRLGKFQNDMLGTEFQIAGYGRFTNDGFYGQRSVGTATARAIKGRWYPLLFDGDYQAYLDWYFTDSSAALPSEEEAREWWKIYRLENNYELLAGGLPGEAVGCFGDSGGPLLLGTSCDSLTTYGVSFAVEGTISTQCGLGAGYLVFNRKMREFVEGAL